MKTPFRAALGFLLGLLLAGFAFLLSGAGHGTYAPMVANVSVLAFIPVFGLFWAVFGAPFQWSLYFILIPKIDSRTKRSIALGLLSLLHFIPGLWLASEDLEFGRALQHHAEVVLAFGLTLLSAFLCLAFVASMQRR